MTVSNTAGGGRPADLEAARDQLWAAVVDRDETAAARAVLEALERWITAGSGTASDPAAAHESVLLDLIAPVQRRIGTEWAANRLTVAAEHAATAIHDRVIAAIAHHLPAPAGPPRGRIVVACADGEWHALPARLVAETLRLRGWWVDFLGAQVPTPHLVTYLHQSWPDAVALSSSIPTRLPAAHNTITACQAVGVPVIVGGAAFGADGRYAELLGADAWAPDARSAADLLAAGPTPSARRPDRQPVDDLPHLADQEYTMVSRRSPQLVREAWTALGAGQRDGVAGYDLADDISQVVGYLSAALYTDSPDLFAEFVRWATEVGVARDIPPTGRYRVLEHLTGQLRDFPRAGLALSMARRVLEDVA